MIALLFAALLGCTPTHPPPPESDPAAQPGETGHDRTEERRPAAQEDGRAAATSQGVLGAADAVLVSADDQQVQYPRSEVLADLEAHAVADDRAHDDHEDQRHDREVGLAGQEAAEEHARAEDLHADRRLPGPDHAQPERADFEEVATRHAVAEAAARRRSRRQRRARGPRAQIRSAGSRSCPSASSSALMTAPDQPSSGSACMATAGLPTAFQVRRARSRVCASSGDGGSG